MRVIKRYVIELRAIGEESFCRAFTALLNAYEPDLTRARVDAFSGYPTLPSGAQQALDELRRIGTRPKKRRGGAWRRRIFSLPSDQLMAIELDLKAREQLQLLGTFGPYSIHTEVYVDGRAGPIITVEDSAVIIFEANGRILDNIRSAGGVPQGSVKELA